MDGGWTGGGAPDRVVMPVPRISVHAFCETQPVAALVEAAARDRRMDKAQVVVSMGGAPAAVEMFRTAPTPNLIVMESLTGDGNQLLGLLDALAETCDPGTKVLVIGHMNDVLLYRELIRRGVSDYLIAPLDLIGLIQAISDLYSGAESGPLGRTIAVTGAKGGVGASTIAHNLAWSLSVRVGTPTVIADLDLPFGTVGLDFNQDPPQGIADAVYSPDRLDANFLDRLLSKCSENLHMLAAPATLDRIYDLDETSFDLTVELLRASTPCVVLDLPHQWNGWTRRQLVTADDIVIVAAPDLANLRNAKVMMDVLSSARPNDRRPRVVINMTGVPKRPEIPVLEFAKALGGDPETVIAFDPQLFGTAANNGKLVVESQPNGKVAEALETLAARLVGRSEAKSQSRAFLKPLLNRLKRARG
ncbi:AAA family ATPase [Alsobacter sp. SYSU M60028]|uniref:AAA family ATPase n=1 Tax=Alsobacter ponti TaxID=2962936 RepID=A0ABT1L9H4_9HYPH|nr:AAA family ATPase [Alsobacter ponti]MCP8938140.1 AAA family ATPase [Alsobacter ponti]